MRKSPPPKRRGQQRGRRVLNGDAVKNIAALADSFKTTEGTIRSLVARGLLPHHRWGSRIIFLTNEVDTFLRQLPGVGVDEAIRNVKARRGGGA